MSVPTAPPRDELVSAPVADARAPDEFLPRRRIDRQRLRGRITGIALIAAAIAAVAESLGAVVTGRLADDPDWRGVALLTLCVVGAAVLDTIGRVAWSAVVDRAEGTLRADLIDAVMVQPLSALSGQAVGEILDRVDDDTHEVGRLLRQSGWRVIRLGFVTVPLLLVAGFTWWPAWVLFPLTGAVVIAIVRAPLARLSTLKVVEEAAWTDHAAAVEEGVAARDDLRTSLGQAYVIRRSAELAANVHDKLAAVARLERTITRRSGLLLHGLLAAVAVSGVALVIADVQDTATLVTLVVVTTLFVGQIHQVTHHLPDLQAGVGALIRLRGVMASPPEPEGGSLLPDGPLDVEFDRVAFGFGDGTFAFDDVSMTIPSGTTLALVGRSGSGKSTLASLLSRAVEPGRGTVFVGGCDVRDLDLQHLRSNVGVVTQRTEIIAGTLAENISLFAPVGADRVRSAVDELGIGEWVDGLPHGLATVLGPGGTTLSAGEEQLVAFARLMVRDVRVIVLDEATARMDPLTEKRVVSAAQRLLDGRTGIVIAHRLGTTERAHRVAVLDAGAVVEEGPRDDLAGGDGPFRRLLDAARAEVVDHGDQDDPGAARNGATPSGALNGAPAATQVGPTRVPSEVGGRRRSVEPPPPPRLAPIPTLASSVSRALRIRPDWGLFSVLLFLGAVTLGANGTITGWVWGNLVEDLQDGGRPIPLAIAMAGALLSAPLLLGGAVGRYPRWWISVMLRVRASVLDGQTRQHRLRASPPGEVVARAMDSDRFVHYCDRWVDLFLGLTIAVLTAVVAGTWVAGAVLLTVMLITAVTSAFGSPAAGRSAAAASTARAGFGRSLVSVLDAIRTVKLAGATDDVHRHLREVDGGRVDAAVREHRIQSMLDGMPVVLVQSGIVAAWAIHVAGGWGLATALLVSTAVSGFEWFGRVAGSVITEAPGTRAWQRETCALAGGGDLMDQPEGVDLVEGVAPRPAPGVVDEFDRLELRSLSVIHDDGTVGVSDVDLVVGRGELVLLLGQIGSGKSSLLSGLAGLVSTEGEIAWNGATVSDAQEFLRPGRVAHVAQIPLVLSGSFADNVRLDHDRDVRGPLADARMERDVADAGGVDSRVGHRGVRLSGGQVQRLALARALATDSEILLADDVSSALDATTEVELWDALRARGRTVIGSSTKRAALVRADRVLVLADGRVVAQGSWQQLAPAWDHLAG